MSYSDSDLQQISVHFTSDSRDLVESWSCLGPQGVQTVRSSGQITDQKTPDGKDCQKLTSNCPATATWQQRRQKMFKRSQAIAEGSVLQSPGPPLSINHKLKESPEGNMKAECPQFPRVKCSQRMGLHADSSSPATVEQALSCAVKREGVSNGKGEPSCSTGSRRSKQLAVALTLADQHGKNGDTMEKILSWQQELNLSEEAWGKLEKELDPAVLSGLLWGWLEHLKQPVLSEADLTNMQSSLTTDRPLQHLNKVVHWTHKRHTKAELTLSRHTGKQDLFLQLRTGKPQQVPTMLAARSCERRYERKHKREHDEETAIPRKRRATAEMVSPSYQAPSFLPEGVAPQHCWGDLNASPQEPAELEGQAAHMEVEGRESVKQWGAAHRRLQEIEDSIIVEDDDEDLETESTNSSFPVLVMSDTLREGLKQGLGDVIPRKIAQSLNHSCMEMVIWRPPEDVLCSKQRETMERLRHSTDSSPVAGAPVLKDRDSELQQHPAQTPVYRDLSQHSCTEEDMEL
ncbi:UNVERIFIED_CONTAM: hypothetical protein FKN15_005643 [Acipenser sinensis]